MVSFRGIFPVLVILFLSSLPVLAADPPSDATPVTIAYDGNPQTNFHYTFMEANGYNLKNGLKVTPQYFQNSKEAATSVVTGNSDFGILNTYTIADMVSDGEKPLIISSVLKQEDIYYLVVNLQKGIVTSNDLAGKKIGIVTGDYWEYYLDRFLILNGIDRSAVTLVSLSPEQITQQMLTGEIDAGVLVWASAVQLTRNDANQFQMWSINNKENFYLVLICSQEYAQAHPDIIKKMITAHIDATDWYAIDSQAAVSVIAQNTEFSPDLLQDLLKGLAAEVSLTQGLLNALEDQTRYIIDKGDSTLSTLPDFLEFIDFSYLDSLKPEADTIIHD